MSRRDRKRNRTKSMIKQRRGRETRERRLRPAERLIEDGVVHHRAGRLEDALACYDQALTLEPQHPVAVHLRGVVDMSRGQLDAAQEQIERAIALDPNFADAHFNLARLHTLRRNQKLAITHYRRALAIDAEHVDAMINLGNALTREEEHDEAVVLLQRVAALRPGEALSYYNLGIALRNAGRCDEAIEAFEHTLRCQANHDDARLELAHLLADAEQWSRARPHLEAAVRLHPYDAGLRVLLEQAQAAASDASARQAVG